jgi:spermidine synthase
MAQVIHAEKSLYRNVLVDETDGRRCLRFLLKANASHNQSCLDLAAPDRLIFDYARATLAGLFFVPQPRTILIIGLGGGTLHMAFHKLVPQARIDVVELDEAVVKAARQYLQFKEDDMLNVFVNDGRIFVKRALKQGRHYDVILLDAFNGDYIPEHMMTREYLQELKVLLSEHGLLMANTFGSSKLYDAESVTYAHVFGNFYYIRNGKHSNRVIFTMPRQPLPAPAALLEQAKQLADSFRPFHADAKRLVDSIQTTPDWDCSARELTDQFVPANLLLNLD